MKRTLPVYKLFGATSDITLSLVRNCDGIYDLTSDWKTSELERKLQAGDEGVMVRVSGHLAIRDGKQYLIFSSIEEIKPGKDL
jgi:hypothetical protein